MTVEVEPLFADRYRLEESLGGGSAQVHRSTDSRLGRTVVVKIAPAGSADLDTARFENETLLLASLRHPGLVTLYDAGAVGDQAYFVMQYVPGGSLAARIRDGALPPEETRQIGLALAEALAYLHEHRVIHRDLKPGNVLLGEDGGVFVADFGIARTVDSARITTTGLVVGTPAYLAPEQARGGEITSACDLYALGLILLECLTGHREYTGTPLEAAMARLHRQPTIPPDLPDPWPRLLTALTAAQPEDRPTARQVAAVLTDEAERTSPLLLIGGAVGEAGEGTEVVGSAAAGGVVGASVVGGSLTGRALAGRPPVRRTVARNLRAGRRAPVLAAAGGMAVVASAGVMLLTAGWPDAHAPQSPAVPAVAPAVQPSHSGASGQPSASGQPGPGGTTMPAQLGPSGAGPGSSGSASPALSTAPSGGSASSTQPPAVTTEPPTTTTAPTATTAATSTTTPTTTSAPPPPPPGPTATEIRTTIATG